MELLVFLELSAPETDCSFVNIQEDQIVKMQIYITVFMNSSPLYHEYSFFSIFFLTSPPCSGRHKTEAKYIAAIKLKCEVVFF